MTKQFQRAAAAVCAAVCLLVVLAAPLQAQVVISQVYGGGGNSGATYRNDFVELFNAGAAAVDVSGYSVQYASSTGSSWQKTNLTGSILPGHYYLVQQAQGAGGTVNLPTPDVIGTIAMSATSGKVALVTNQTALSGTCPAMGPATAIADFVGFGGANCSETAPTPGLSNTTAALRAGAGCTDTGSNSADFSTGAPDPRNSASAQNVCSTVPTPTPPSAAGSATPSSVMAGEDTLIKVQVTPGANPDSTGLAVSVNLGALGGASAQSLFDDGSNGDVTSGDNTFSYLATVSGSATPGVVSLPVSVSDAQGRTASAAISLTITPSPVVLAIHDIQGSGVSSTVPLNTLIETAGIVTAVKSNGFFLQTPDGLADPDDNTSEGVFVYTGGAAPGVATAGAELKVRGCVSEYAPDGSGETVTEILNCPGILVSAVLVSSGNALPAPLNLTAADFSTTDHAKLERVESMLVHVDSVTATGPTGATGTASDGVFFAVLPGFDRPFREPGMPLWLKPSTPAGIPVFDNNPELLAVDSSQLAPLEIAAGSTVSDLTGVLDSNGFRLLLVTGTPTITPNAAAVAAPAPGARDFTVASFNLLNFGPSGTPPLATRLVKASQVIRELMHMPDLIGVEEMANLSTLQMLAEQINTDAGSANPGYFPYIGTLGSSQKVGILVKTSRVTVVGNAVEEGLTEQFLNPNTNTMYATFSSSDRAPLVLHATITPPVGQPFPVTFIVNHLRSLINVETDPFVRAKRLAQAQALAKIIQQHQAGEHVIAVGDLNAFQFNDGYVDVLGSIMGVPAPADEVMLAGPDLVDPDVTDLVNAVPADQRYSYVENGSAQVLDHVLITGGLLARSPHLSYVRNNADFPESWGFDISRPERVSDHDIPVAYFSFPPPQADLATTIALAADPVLSGDGQSYTVTVMNNGPDPAASARFETVTPTNTTFQSVLAPAGWSCTAPSTGGTGKVSCTAATLAAGASAQFTLTVALQCALGNGTAISNLVTATSDYDDPNAANNDAAATFAVSNPAPALGTVSVDKPVLSPPNHKLVDVFLDYSLSDNCGNPNVAVTVSSNQPLNGTGDGNTAYDWQVIDSKHVLLRAERAPSSAAGRTYTITVIATDSAGSAASQSVKVSVPR